MFKKLDKADWGGVNAIEKKKLNGNVGLLY